MTKTNWGIQTDPKPWVNPKDAAVLGEEGARHSNCSNPQEDNCKLKPREKYAQEIWRYGNPCLVGFVRDLEVYGAGINASPAFLLKMWLDFLDMHLKSQTSTASYSLKQMKEAQKVLLYWKAYNDTPAVEPPSYVPVWKPMPAAAWQVTYAKSTTPNMSYFKPDQIVFDDL